MQLPDTLWRAKRSEYSRYGPRMAPTETIDLPRNRVTNIAWRREGVGRGKSAWIEGEKRYSI